jgi:hypothetical protein
MRQLPAATSRLVSRILKKVRSKNGLSQVERFKSGDSSRPKLPKSARTRKFRMGEAF